MAPLGLGQAITLVFIVLVYGALIAGAFLLVRSVVRISVAAESIAESLRHIAGATPSRPPEMPASE